MTSARPWALITGGTSGIGLGIARALVDDYDLVLAYARNKTRAQAALAELQARDIGSRVRLMEQELSTGKDAQALFERACEEFGDGGGPSVLVNSAGRIDDGLAMALEFEALERTVQEHLLVSMALCQAALKPMYKAKFGRIINLSSISAHYSKRGQSAYAAAKGGIEAFTRTLALEVAHRGVTVNAIAPGLIATPMTEKLLEGFAPQELRSRIPAGYAGEPEDVGALARFLCSREARYITGAVIPIDGGRSLGDPNS